MRHLILLLALTPILAQAQSDKDAQEQATAAVQKLFDAMAAHNGEAIRALLLPGAQFYSVRGDAAPASTAGEQFAARIGTMKESIVERMWDVQVLVRGRMAQIWAPYDFHRNGAFTHCGVDQVTLFKTETGWKIQTIAYTVETTGCDTSRP